MKHNLNHKAVLARTIAALLLSAVLAPPAAADDVFAAAANIPFAFAAKGVNLPAGAYRVRLETNGGVLVLDQIGGRRLMFLVHPASDSTRTATPRLVFHKEGDEAALTEVYFAATGCGYKLPAATPTAKGGKVQIALVNPR